MSKFHFMKPLKITVLSDNVAGRKCLAEHGLSFWIEADRNILFDTGSSDLFRHNASILGIDPDRADAIVLSHGHDDHTGGLHSVSGKKLICHPETFTERYRKSNRSALGIRHSEEEVRERFELVTSRSPVRISDQIYFMGEIPRKNDFESQTTAFITADGTDDFVTDDSGIAIVTRKGLVVVSGCAHSGICNMIDHAREITGIREVYMVIGGFHLRNDDELTQKTIDWLVQEKVEKAVPSHCTGFQALTAFYKTFPFIQVKTGNKIVIE